MARLTMIVAPDGAPKIIDLDALLSERRVIIVTLIVHRRTLAEDAKDAACARAAGAYVVCHFSRAADAEEFGRLADIAESCLVKEDGGSAAEPT